MKALVIDNKIVSFFNQLPKEWKNYLNFDLAEESVIKSEGFYDVVDPSYDPDTHRLGEYFYDKKKEIVTCKLAEIPIEEVTDQLYSEVDSVKQRVRMDFLEAVVESLIDIHKDDLPPVIVSMYYGTKMKFNKLENDIRRLTPAKLRKYKVMDDEMENLVTRIRDLKKSKR